MGALPPLAAEAAIHPRGIWKEKEAKGLDAVPDVISQRVDAEIARRRESDPIVLAFQDRRVGPEPVDVQFAGAVMRICWTVTDSDGDYRVLYIPDKDCFALCAEGPFGPLDIGVHGDAIECFSSV